MAQVIVHQPGAPAHIGNGAALRRRAGHAGYHVVRLRKVEFRVEQNGLHGRRRVDLAHAQHGTAHAVGVAVDGAQGAGYGNGGGVFPVPLVPVLELTRTVAGVLADFEHGGDEDLDADGCGAGCCRGRRRAAGNGQRSKGQQQPARRVERRVEEH